MIAKTLMRAAAFVALATAAGAGIANAETATKWKGAPETSEEDRTFHVSGRFMYDMAYTSADFADAVGTPAEDSFRTYSRRAFLGVDGRFTKHWRYNAKFDFGFGSAGSIKADDFYLEYAGDSGSIFIGNSNAVSPLEDRDSSLNIPFNERSFLITAGGFGKKPGVAYLTNGGNWSWGVGVQSGDGLDSADSATAGNESGFVISRLTYAPIYKATPAGKTLLGFGLTGRLRDNGSGGSLSYSPSALSAKASNSAAVSGFGKDTYIGGEAVFQMNAFGADAEYGHFDTGDGIDASADGYYIDVFWSPTGEGRNYSPSDGSFGATAPIRPLGAGGIGHIMLAARYENLDLSDALFGANRNETSAYTIGATWIPVSHVKFQLNYSSTDVDYALAAPTRFDNTIDAVTFRTQLDW